MYGNNYLGGYQPQMSQIPNPYQARLNAMQNDFVQRQDIVRVNGENGAMAYNMPPNSRALLLDENMPIVWLAQTDGAGYKTVTPYTIAPYQPEPPVDTKTLETRIQRLEDIINGKSNFTDVKPEASTTNATDNAVE